MRMDDRVTTRPDRNPDLDPDREGVSDSLLPNTRCCFFLPCFSSRPPSSSAAWWQRIRHRHEDRWWSRAFLRVREWSEIVAGPRWKTFIRRFNRNNNRHSGAVGGEGDRHGRGQFQYDAMSYALNFDEGLVVEDANGNADEDRVYGGFRSFSTRYAAVQPWNKKTKDGGGGQREEGV